MLSTGLIAEVSDRLQGQHRDDCLAPRRCTSRVLPASHTLSVEIRWLLIRERNKTHRALELLGAKQPRKLEKASSAARVVVGSRGSLSRVVMSTDNDNLLRPRTSLDLDLKICKSETNKLELVCHHVISETCKNATNVLGCLFEIRLVGVVPLSYLFCEHADMRPHAVPYSLLYRRQQRGHITVRGARHCRHISEHARDGREGNGDVDRNAQQYVRPQERNGMHHDPAGNDHVGDPYHQARGNEQRPDPKRGHENMPQEDRGDQAQPRRQG